MTEILDNLPPAVLLVLVLLLVVWLVLLLLVPFMIESIRGWTRKSHRELVQLNEKMDRVIELLAQREADAASAAAYAADFTPLRPPPDRPAREPRAERVRKEPTISG